MSSSQAISAAALLRGLGLDASLAVGVPHEVGGAGGSLVDLLDLIEATARESVRKALMFASQRLLIEAVLTARNIALREHCLPSLLAGDIGGGCAASWALDETVEPLHAIDTGRGWLMTGMLKPMPNLDTGWFLVSLPVSFDSGKTYSLVMLRSEENGLRLHKAGEAGLSLELTKVFLREDEILSTDGPAATAHLANLSVLVQAAVWAGASRAGTPTGAADVSPFEVPYRDLRESAARGEAVTAYLPAIRAHAAQAAGAVS